MFFKPQYIKTIMIHFNNLSHDPVKLLNIPVVRKKDFSIKDLFFFLSFIYWGNIG